MVLSEPVANGETNAEALKKYGIKAHYTQHTSFLIIYLVQSYCIISRVQFFFFTFLNFYFSHRSSYRSAKLLSAKLLSGERRVREAKSPHN
ncbi:hypothetical protein CICLE_v10004076mg [Citrus x clementina]|uniref:Uncharacterized protein n=1 Tax=Citrus clementina TaxID=85681 RepID=V4TEE4_CITCL|nr:hypothetical protein CICLE_v10004076mg [Citrus x clementina]